MKFKFRAPENPTLLLIATTLHPVEGNGAYLQLSSNQGKGENPREGKFGAANRQGTMQSELIINIPRVCYQWEISHFRSMRFTEILVERAKKRGNFSKSLTIGKTEGRRRGQQEDEMVQFSRSVLSDSV